MSRQGVQGGIDGALGRADEAYGFLSPPWGSELAGSWTVFGADGGLRLSEVVRDLMPAAAPLERYGNPAGYLILAYMFVQCPAEHAEIAYVFARRQLARWRIF